MKIYLLQNFRGKKAGNVIEVSDKLGDYLLRSGIGNDVLMDVKNSDLEISTRALNNVKTK